MQTRRFKLVLASAAFLMVFTPSRARADLLLNGCSPARIPEHFFNVTDCIVSNNGPEDATITGSSVVAFPVGPDLSDRVIALFQLGERFPMIPAGGAHDFQYILFTPIEIDGPPDFGISIVSPVYSAVDTDGLFVKGSYTGGVAAVVDDLTVPIVGVPIVNPFLISSQEDFTTTQLLFEALARESGGGSFSSVPEPASALFVCPALAALAILRRRRAANP